MFSFVARRLAVAVPTLLILVVISFVLMYAAPGGPFNSERPLHPKFWLISKRNTDWMTHSGGKS